MNKMNGWIEWVQAILKDINGWEGNRVIEQVRIEDMEKGAPIVDLE